MSVSRLLFIFAAALPALAGAALCPSARGQGTPALAAPGPAVSARGLTVRPVIDPRSPSAVPPGFPSAGPGATAVPADPRPAAPVGSPLGLPAVGPSAVGPARPIAVAVRPGGPRAPRSVQSLSLTHLNLPEPRAIATHDIITILVDEKSEVAVQSRFDRRRNTSLEASVDEFVRLDPTGRLILSATGDPKVDLGAGVRVQSDGRSLDTEAVRYRIAAEVVDVLPNGNVVLEARKEIRSNKDVWEYTLTGTIASQKVNRDMTALSEDVAALKIEKNSTGKVHNSARRAWGVRALDWLWPF